MEQKSISNLITQFFSVDHERLDFLFRMYREHKKDEPYKAILIFEKFAEGLKKHIEWEEELLFPAYDRVVKSIEQQSPTHAMCLEHQEINWLLDKILLHIKRKQASEALEKELTELLLLHNEKEEQVLYIKCDRAISDSTLTDILLEM
ncbi:MAG: hemerythrin domain-containing protein [Glaciecola sp.]|jgi:hemerythrin-like domain-containing protein